MRPVHLSCGVDLEEQIVSRMRDGLTLRLSAKDAELHAVVTIAGQCGEDGWEKGCPAMEG